MASAVPWTTMAGTTRAAAPIAANASSPCASGSGPPRGIAWVGGGRLRALPNASPEWIASAANTSGYVAAITAAIAPPADIPATNTRAGSIVQRSAASATARVAPAIDAGSPPPRAWCDVENQFQQQLGLSSRDCSGYATTNPWRSAVRFMRLPAENDAALCVQPWSITSSGAGVAGSRSGGAYTKTGR